MKHYGKRLKIYSHSTILINHAKVEELLFNVAVLFDLTIHQVLWYLESQCKDGGIWRHFRVIHLSSIWRVGNFCLYGYLQNGNIRRLDSILIKDLSEFMGDLVANAALFSKRILGISFLGLFLFSTKVSTVNRARCTINIA